MRLRTAANKILSCKQETENFCGDKTIWANRDAVESSFHSKDTFFFLYAGLKKISLWTQERNGA